MRTSFRQKIPHLVVWLVLFVYLFSARDLYARFVLRNGKPVQASAGQSTEVSDSIYWIDGLSQVRYEGQDLFLLHGWGLKKDTFGIPLEKYSKQVLLQSSDDLLVFGAQNIPRPGLNDALKDKIPPVDATYAGFQAYLSKDVIPTGAHRIGIRYFSPEEDSDYYFWTNRYLQRTPNTLTLTDTPVESEAWFDDALLNLKRLARRILR